MNYPTDPPPPGETGATYSCGTPMTLVGQQVQALQAEIAELRDKLRAAEMNLSDLRDCLAQNEELSARITGLEAMLCDAQEEIGELKGKVAARDDALRPFAHVYRVQKPADYADGVALGKFFARAAELIPEENT